MAEGFARRYGSDVIEPLSAGFAPAAVVQPLTKKVMEEKNIKVDDQYPKSLDSIEVPKLDLIVNMSGVKLPKRLQIQVRDWKVEDPMGKSEDTYVVVRDQIEMSVMGLILELRKQARNGENIPLERGFSGRGNREFK
jgi:arsenate reductase (thioredoxin)